MKACISVSTALREINHLAILVVSILTYRPGSDGIAVYVRRILEVQRHIVLYGHERFVPHF
jgi:hypothetical protein